MPSWTSNLQTWERIKGYCFKTLSGHEVKVAQLCPTLCDPMDYTVYGVLQARMLKWVAFRFTRVSSQTRDQTQVSCIAGRFFTGWATREAQVVICYNNNGKWTHQLLDTFTHVKGQVRTGQQIKEAQEDLELMIITPTSSGCGKDQMHRK